METIRLLLAIAIRYNLKGHMADIIGAYLNGELDEEIYMQQPKEYHNGTNRVWKLLKSLYRLKQSSRVWNLTLDTSFKKLNYTQLISDQCIYIRQNAKEIAIVAVHVDDMSIFASSNELMKTIKNELAAKFSIKKLGKLCQLLGMEIHRDNKSIKITQTQYITKILK